MFLELIYILLPVTFFLYFIYQFYTVRFYMRMAFYGFCVVFGSLLGGILSIPCGRTTDNHFRIFKIFQFMCRPLGVKFDIRNKELLELDEPYIIIANHQSAFDVLGMSFVWPKNCVVMLKSSLKFLPGFNLCAYLCHSIFINRFSKAKATKAVDETYKEIVNNKRKVWIYPEGTRNPERQILPFKKGAFILAKEADIKIVPVVFSQHNFFYNYDLKYFKGGLCRAEVLPAVDTSKFNGVEDLRDHCQQIIQNHREVIDKEVEKEILGL